MKLCENKIYIFLGCDYWYAERARSLLLDHVRRAEPERQAGLHATVQGGLLGRVVVPVVPGERHLGTLPWRTVLLRPGHALPTRIVCTQKKSHVSNT